MEAALLLGLVAPEAVRDSLFDAHVSCEFTSAYRILRAEGFNHVIQAENLTNKFFKIFFVRNGKRNARLGIIASKRILAGAVQRNRIKRAIREVFRQHSIKVQPLDLVVMVRGAEAQASQSEGLKMLLSRIENICASS